MSFECDPRQELVLKFLRENKISLWLEPYFVDGRSEIPADFVTAVAESCSIPFEIARSCLTNLQEHAISRIHEKTLYEKDQVVTIRVRIRGEEHVYQLGEKARVSELFDKVAESAGVPASIVRLIHSGKLLEKRDIPLNAAEIRNNAKLAALIISADVSSMLEEEKVVNARRQEIEATKNIAKIGSALGEFQITNQFGAEVNLPPEVQRSLTLALTLHNQALKKVKSGEHEDALVFLLEAEELFDSVNLSHPEVLKGLSNIAQLNLDILWCFFKLNTMIGQQEAETRLGRAERNLHETYGPNLEKVTKIKGAAVNELTFFTRLEILRGILEFHKANFNCAKENFSKAESYITRMAVDETYLNTIMMLGYSAKDARLALRQTQNNPDAAVAYLTKKWEDIKAQEKKNRREKRDRALKGVDQTLYKRLLDDIGLSAATARQALLECENDYQRACDRGMEIQCEKTRSRIEDQASPQGSIPGGSPTDGTLTEAERLSYEEGIQKLIEMGEEPSHAKELMQIFQNDVGAICEYLLSGQAPPNVDISSVRGKLEGLISHDPEDYLDSTFEEETNCLRLFQAKIATIEAASAT